MSYRKQFNDYCHVFGPWAPMLVAAARLARRPMTWTRVPRGAHYPVTLRLRTSDVETYREVFLREPYQVRLRTPPRVIVDAGANIGLTSVYYAIRYPEARIFALEPEAHNFALLVSNIAPYPDITALRAALWGENTDLEVVDPGRGDWGFRTVTRNTARPDIQRVPAITVDTLMRMHGLESIDVLKVDIEGAEKEVFADASAWIDRVGVLMVELHERYKMGCNRSVYSATEGFDVEWMRGPNVIFLARRGMLDDEAVAFGSPAEAESYGI